MVLENPRSILIFVLKIVVLTFVMFVAFTVGGLVTGITSMEVADPTGAFVTSLFIIFLQTVVLSYAIVRSRWTGWKLVLAIIVIYYGVVTFQTNVETVVFLNYLVDIVPTEMLPILFVQGAITAGIFAPLATVILGRMKDSEGGQEPNLKLVMPGIEWVWKLVVIAVIWVGVYFAFGAFVAVPLAGEVFQEYYAGLQLPAWMPLFQLVRGVIWVAVAAPVIRMMKGHWWETALVVGLLFSFLMGFWLLAPNPFMPEVIRMAHFVEVSSENFIFGFVLVYILKIRQRIPPT